MVRRVPVPVKGHVTALPGARPLGRRAAVSRRLDLKKIRAGLYDTIKQVAVIFVIILGTFMGPREIMLLTVPVVTLLLLIFVPRISLYLPSLMR